MKDSPAKFRSFPIFPILFCLFILNAVSAYSQASYKEGIIISNEGDTIHGYIYSKGDVSLTKECRFKSNLKEDPGYYEPFSIKAFRFDKSGRYYISKLVEIEERLFPMFVEYVLDGVVDLYYYKDNWSEHYLIDRNLANQTLIELSNDEKELIVQGKTYDRKTNRYIGVLKAGFSDTPELYPAIQNSIFHRNSFIDISKQYHELVCNEGEECIVYEKKQSFFNLMPGLITGFGSANLIIPESQIFSDIDFGNELYFQYGLGVNLSSGIFNEHVLLHISFLKEISSYSGDVTYNYTLLSKYYDYKIDLNSSKLNFAAGYQIPRGKIQPYILPGFTANFGNASIEENLISIFNGEQSDSYEKSEHKARGYSLFLRTGFNYFLSNRLFLGSYLEGRYTSGSFKALKNINYIQNGMNISLGVFYKL